MILTKFGIRRLQYAWTRELNRALHRSHITLVYLQHKSNSINLLKNGLSYKHLLHVIKHKSH
jgi:hypothetical protein